MNPVRSRAPHGGRSRAFSGTVSCGVNIPEGLPGDAQRIFKGQIWDIWQWEQREFDGTLKTYERAVRRGSVTVIPIIGGHILIQRQEQPLCDSFISLPGGSRENEFPLDDAKRELLEETGYRSDEWKLNFIWSPPASKLKWENHFYIARNCKKVQAPALDAGERIALRIVSFDDFLALADDPAWRHQDFVPTMLRARFMPEKRKELETLLFS